MLEKPRPDDGKMYTARTAVKYMHQRSQNDQKWRKCNVADELVRDGLIPVHHDNMLSRYNHFAKSIKKDGQVEAALDRVRPFHERGTGFLVEKQECIEFARSMAHHDRAIAVGDVASFLTSARKRKAEEAGMDASMCRQVCPKTVKGYLQVMELWSILLNHHLHERDNTSCADPADCSSYGAPHATCRTKPNARGAHKQPRPET